MHYTVYFRFLKQNQLQNCNIRNADDTDERMNWWSCYSTLSRINCFCPHYLRRFGALCDVGDSRCVNVVESQCFTVHFSVQ